MSTQSRVGSMHSSVPRGSKYQREFSMCMRFFFFAPLHRAQDDEPPPCCGELVIPFPWFRRNNKRCNNCQCHLERRVPNKEKQSTTAEAMVTTGTSTMSMPMRLLQTRQKYTGIQSHLLLPCKSMRKPLAPAAPNHVTPLSLSLSLSTC